jgi:hypothetical protein
MAAPGSWCCGCVRLPQTLFFSPTHTQATIQPPLPAPSKTITYHYYRKKASRTTAACLRSTAGFC